jgi:murein DD-endopeptidase MepM/ murein hydrolase activator NlpD
MSSKAEKTSNHSHQPLRLNIFFRSPLLLKIVAWVGSLSFIGSTGLALADLRPISLSEPETPKLVEFSLAGIQSAAPEVYGPHLPTAQAQSLNREVPVAVTPGSATILPTGTVVRPQHTDLLTADNYTVGVNGSTLDPKVAVEFVNIPVPAPLKTTIPTQQREIVTVTKSQVQPSYAKPPSVLSQSVPTTSIQSQPKSVAEASSLPPARSISPQVGRSLSQTANRAGTNVSTPISVAPSALKDSPRPVLTPQVIPLAGIKPTVVTPMKPSGVGVKSPTAPVLAVTPATAVDSMEISVPAPRQQRVEVQPVARLPQVSSIKAVPVVPAIPSVRPAAVASGYSKPIAFVNTGTDGSSLELIYPLSSPAPTTSGFGWRTHPITGSRRFHSGVDIGAPMGAPVVAAGTGIVMSSGWLGGYGKAIVIQHNGVQQTLYGHLSEVFVQPGQRIEQGTVIGRVGSTGNSTGPHLHFESKMATADGWVAVDPGEDIKYALDNLRRTMPFAQRDLPPGYN